MNAIRISAVLLVLAMTARAQGATASVQWLDGAPPPTTQGVTWGVPWPKGAVTKDQSAYSLRAADGKVLPVQSWPLAFWPDGSIKWTAIASVVPAETAGPFNIVSGAPPAGAFGANRVQVVQGMEFIDVETGPLSCRIPKQGSILIESLSVDGRYVARHGRLECILQSGPETDLLHPPAREGYVSQVERVVVEQNGPVRAVVRFEGNHKAQEGDRQWLPFVVRLYFYAGQTPVKMVHTITFDGNEQTDFIRGLGLTFDVPMREEVQNRHVRFANSNGGLWAEPVLLPGGPGGGGGGRGGAVPPPGPASQPQGEAAGPTTVPAGGGRFGGRGFGGGFGGFGRGGANQLDGQRIGSTTSELARWDAFKLVQPNSEGFTIVKRTNSKSSWVAAAEGNRAAGFVFVGDTNGGLAVGVKNFWQSYPASLEVQGATGDVAQLHVWLWSPDGPAMDMRHYDTRGHGPVNGGSGSYEDYEAEYATPMGVSRTSDLMLFPSAGVPTRADTVKQAQVNSQPPLLVTTPEYLHSTGIFGVWSLPDSSTPFKKEVEDRLAGAIDLYQKAIDQHHWFGYWNFGDIRHAYDAQRHVWRYDVGGYAWDNTELGSVLWVWYSYIRTGRADTFRMAEAMTRHTTEVDVHHLGPYEGLGSRHNVSHWGDSAKEARISQASHSRFYYYMTADERTGDNMRMVTNVDEIAARLDPMRKAQPKTEEEAKYPGRIRVGPDWLAFVGNWMTEWERTGDKKWKDKIMAGVDSLYDMPYWMRSGLHLVVGYDPATGKLYKVSDEIGDYNLPTIQGGGEVAMELVTLLDDPKFAKMWLQYCRLGKASAQMVLADKSTGAEGNDGSLVGEQGNDAIGTNRLAAYAYYKTKSAGFAQRAIQALIPGSGARGAPSYVTRRVEGPETLNPVDEAAGVSTNTAAQSSLQTIEILEMCADQLPAETPASDAAGGGGRRGGRGGRGARGQRGATSAPSASGE